MCISQISDYYVYNLCSTLFLSVERNIGNKLLIDPYCYYYYYFFLLKPAAQSQVEKNNIVHNNKTIIHFIETRLQNIQLAQ